MTSAFFDQFPALWDSFESLLEGEYVKRLSIMPLKKIDLSSGKLSALYRDLGWKYWRFGGGGTRWTVQFEDIFFESRYYSVKNLLYGYGNLDALVAQSLETLQVTNSEEIYRVAVKPHFDARRKELIRKLADLEKELHEPKPYIMNQSLDGSSQGYRLEFWERFKKSKLGSGMDGYTYSFNGRSYHDVNSLWKEQVEELSEDIDIGNDQYGEKVLRTYTQIPTFDSGDREWDSKEMEYLFFDGKDVQLVVMRGGYRIASLTFYTKLLAADTRMKPIFEKLGWPTNSIEWI